MTSNKATQASHCSAGHSMTSLSLFFSFSFLLLISFTYTHTYTCVCRPVDWWTSRPSEESTLYRSFHPWWLTIIRPIHQLLQEPSLSTFESLLEQTFSLLLLLWCFLEPLEHCFIHDIHTKTHKHKQREKVSMWRWPEHFGVGGSEMAIGGKTIHLYEVFQMAIALAIASVTFTRHLVSCQLIDFFPWNGILFFTPLPETLSGTRTAICHG